MDNLIENQTTIRMTFAVGGLLLFWGLGRIFPYRKTPALKNWLRFFINTGISFGNGLIISLLSPLALYQLATTPALEKWAIPLFPLTPFWLQFLFGAMILDLVIYWQHRLTHTVPLLWKLHRLHHSDIEFDATTAGRFHILEIIMSFFVKAFFIIVFAIPAPAVIFFEILLNFSALFNHGNFQLPLSIEKPIRWILITPDIHRIHHSTLGKEMNSNYGFSISLWDRIFKSYLEKSKEDPQNMMIGLKKFREPKDQKFLALFFQPFSKK